MGLGMSRSQWETVAGVGLGLIGAVLGLGLTAAWWAWNTGDTMAFFVREVFWNGGLYQDSIVTVSVLVDVGLFYGLLRWDREAVARGVMAVILAAVPVVVYLQMINLEPA